MIVVSDTSPLSALLRIGHCDLLEQLYGEVVIPTAVQNELLVAFPVLPKFLSCQKVVQYDEVTELLEELDVGEAEAIVLAREKCADILLMDEQRGRRRALREGIPIIGLVGILLLAKRKGMISSVSELIIRLENEAGFYLSTELKERVFQQAGES